MNRPRVVVPQKERPRERLLELGGSALADAELLAVLLRTGRVGASAFDLANQLLAERGGLGGLLTLDASSLRRSGLGPAKIASVLASVEIGRRLARVALFDRKPLARLNDAVHYLFLRYQSCEQEVMGALYLDARDQLLGERELFRGTLDRIAVAPREVLREGLRRGAASVYLFHTHPSGDPEPSGDDLLFTRRLAEAAELVGLRLIDHIVLGHEGRWSSIRAKGAW